jgi:hypothetical protein
VVLDHSRKVKPKNENAHEGRIAAEANGVFKQIAADLGGREDYDGIFYLYRGHKYLTKQLDTADDAKDEEKIRARFAREKWQEDEAEIGALKARWSDPSRKVSPAL